MPWLAITSSAALAALLALLAPPRAQAHDNGFYVSLKYGTTDVDASFGDAFDQVVDGDDDSKTIEAGYRWSRYFAIQGGYHEFGEVPGFGTPCSDDDEVCLPIDVPIEAETKAYSLSLVPQFPLGKRFRCSARWARSRSRPRSTTRATSSTSSKSSRRRT